jgi:hypothetical protein
MILCRIDRYQHREKLDQVILVKMELLQRMLLVNNGQVVLIFSFQVWAMLLGLVLFGVSLIYVIEMAEVRNK